MAIFRLFDGLLNIGSDVVESAAGGFKRGLFEFDDKPAKLSRPEVMIGPTGIGRISDMLNDPESAFDTNFKIAEQMRRRGELNEDIIARTGFIFDENGTPKYELDDADAEFIADLGKIKKNETYPMSSVMQHDSLFAVYPELRDTKIKFIENNNPNSKGYIDLDKLEIGVNMNTDQFQQGDLIGLVGTLLHETQHALQKKEKFDLGGDWQSFLPDPKKFTDKEYKEAFKKYLNVAGEIEARNVEFRYTNPKVAKKTMEANKKMGFDFYKPVSNVIRSRNYLQTLGKDPESVQNQIDPRTAISPTGMPVRMLSEEEPVMYQDPFERTV
jgi:hypothetical protein